MDTHTQEEQEQEQEQEQEEEQEQIKNKKNEMDNKFEIFYNKYPKKLAKDKARKVFLKLEPSDVLFENILSAVEAHKQTNEWIKEKGQFIPYPATWLNQKRWEDDLKVTNQAIVTIKNDIDPELERRFKNYNK